MKIVGQTQSWQYKKNLKQSEIDLIKSWNSESLSNSEIAKRLKRSPATIRRFFVVKKATFIHSDKEENWAKIKARLIILPPLYLYLSLSLSLSLSNMAGI